MIAAIEALREVERAGNKVKVMLRGTPITPADISSYLRKKKMTEDELLESADETRSRPPYLTFEPVHESSHTPTHSRSSRQSYASLPAASNFTSPSWISTSTPSDSARPSSLHTPKSLVSHDASLTSFDLSRYDFSVDRLDNSTTNFDGDANQGDTRPMDDDEEVDFEFSNDMVLDEDMEEICRAATFSEELNAVVNQMFRPRPVAERHATDPMIFNVIAATPRCQSISTRPSGSQPAKLSSSFDCSAPFDLANQVDVMDQHRGPSSTYQSIYGSCQENWVDAGPLLSKCFEGCILQSQGLCSQADSAIDTAARDFAKVIEHQGPCCLATLNVLVAVLEAHGQGELAQRFLSEMLDVSDGCLGPHSPVTATVDFMLKAAARSFRKSKYNHAILRAIHQELAHTWGNDSPSALTGLYNLAWRLASDAETLVEAQELLVGLKDSCESVLGPFHVLTICCMTTLARVLFRLKRSQDAQSMMGLAINRVDEVFEEFHPYRLEARRRQAIILFEYGLLKEAEEILQDAVWHQCAVLGCQNPRTLSSTRVLQKLLRRLGKAVDADRLPQKLSQISLNEEYLRWPYKAYHERV